MLPLDFLNVQVKTMAEVGAAGVMLWGSSSFVNTQAKCQQIQQYISNVLGPLVNETLQDAEVCSKEHCGSKGRCITYQAPPPNLPPTRVQQVSFSGCRCFPGVKGDSCQTLA